MAWRNRLRCYICDGTFLPAQMSRINGDENAARRKIAIVRRDSFNRPVLEITRLEQGSASIVINPFLMRYA